MTALDAKEAGKGDEPGGPQGVAAARGPLDIDGAAAHGPLDIDGAAAPGPLDIDGAAAPGPLDVDVIEDPAAAAVALDPIRARLLADLADPASAAALAERVGLSRQKVNYHLRTLEAHGLVRAAGERRWGGLTERLLVATAASYVVSPGALGEAAADPARAQDRLSARFLIALAARIVREVAGLARRAESTGKRLPVLALDTEIRFRSPAERATFTDELTGAVTALVSRYHDAAAPGGRSHRLLVAAHPLPQTPDPEEDA